MFENRSQQSKTEVKARIERIQNASHEQICFLLKKRVRYQYSSSSRKKTHTFTIIAMNFVQEQLITQNEEVKLEKVTLEVTECSRKKRKNGQKFTQKRPTRIE